jgi:hypothetical protein
VDLVRHHALDEVEGGPPWRLGLRLGTFRSHGVPPEQPIKPTNPR